MELDGPIYKHGINLSLFLDRWRRNRCMMKNALLESRRGRRRRPMSAPPTAIPSRRSQPFQRAIKVIWLTITAVERQVLADA
jgi:hypothetical protein